MVEAELGWFGDKRLADVGNALLASMRSERTLCLPQLAKDRNQFVQFGSGQSGEGPRQRNGARILTRRTGEGHEGPRR